MTCIYGRRQFGKNPRTEVIAERKIPRKREKKEAAGVHETRLKSSRASERAEIRLWTNRVINTYGWPRTQLRTRVSHMLARACVTR